MISSVVCTVEPCVIDICGISFNSYFTLFDSNVRKKRKLSHVCFERAWKVRTHCHETNRRSVQVILAFYTYTETLLNSIHRTGSHTCRNFSLFSFFVILYCSTSYDGDLRSITEYGHCPLSVHSGFFCFSRFEQHTSYCIERCTRCGFSFMCTLFSAIYHVVRAVRLIFTLGSTYTFCLSHFQACLKMHDKAVSKTK